MNFAKGLLLLLAAPLSASALSVNARQIQITPFTTDVVAQVHLEPGEQVYRNTVLVSANSPYIDISAWTTDHEASALYDKNSKITTLGFDKDFSLFTTATVQTDAPVTQADLHISLKSSLKNQADETKIALNFLPRNFSLDETADQSSSASYANQVSKGTTQTKASSFFGKVSASIKNFLSKVFDIRTLSNTLTTTRSIPLQVLLALILGILLSLTPCIYPMIPITVGVLQAQGSKSVLQNFMLSLAYTLGLSTTFACMGLLAASTSQAFGQMLANPIFVVFIVAVLCYFAFSLFGFYNLYLPRFLQQKRSISGGGSFLSIFIFGLMSGTVASPCLSPGLALILSMVASMANKSLGFFLLFAFGIGISTPLLIIGTFSSSLKVLPKAGMWMLEVQKVFGFMLIGMSFYYLNNILPWSIIIVMLTISALCMGIFYLRSITPQDSGAWKAFKNIIGIGAIAASVFLFVESIKEIYYPKLDDGIEATWYTDYDKAVHDAQDEGKKILVDFWASHCSVCKLIAQKVLKNPSVVKALQKDYIVLSVDGSNSHLEPYVTLKPRYQVQGFPTILIIDPHTGQELRRWLTELEDEDLAVFIQELEKHAQH